MKKKLDVHKDTSQFGRGMKNVKAIKSTCKGRRCGKNDPCRVYDRLVNCWGRILPKANMHLKDAQRALVDLSKKLRAHFCLELIPLYNNLIS